MFSLKDMLSIGGTILGSLTAILTLLLGYLFGTREPKTAKSDQTQTDDTIASLRDDVADLRSSFEIGFSAESRDI
jgi:hypothetical protein